MTAFLALVRKDLILFLHDRRALLMSLALPIVIASFFGFLFGGGGEKQGSAIEVALVLNDASQAASDIAAGLQADPSLAVARMGIDEARAAVRSGKRKAAIVLPAGFGEAAGNAFFGTADKPEIVLLYDPSQPAVLSMVKGMLTQQVMQVVSNEMFNGAGGREINERNLRALAAAPQDAETAALRGMLEGVVKYQSLPPKEGQAGPQKAGLSTPFTTRDEALAAGKADGPQGYNPFAHAFAGMGVQFLLFMGIEMGTALLHARNSGVWSRLLAAPVALSTLLLARAASSALIAFAILCVIFLFSVVVFQVHISSLAGFAGVAVCFALVTASFGVLVAAFGKTPEVARKMAMFATLLMVMIGGAWVPSFMFPAWLQQASLAMPTRWAVEGFDAITWRGMDLDAVLPAMGAQLGFALLFAALAVWRFRKMEG
ncbi:MULTISPECIES: ABC transporter permease [unclassified Massilia]|uniref:ABC transporter permease n=1 Tax=unclassified Massilia TaxID=2609279 RepID=UPI001785C100|nr:MULTISPECIES: ABC transporter permease [unclassified Massilia]MBD8530625.1 ABC-2 transporter permease [Massilia sp. CFBP 13647]MBD8674850.1 ABC-2 transporter permease [Massilia sp. CFBP 13721]